MTQTPPASGPLGPPGHQPPIQHPAKNGAPPQKAGILDVRFTRFLSLSLISVWWVAALVLIVIGMVVGIIVGLTRLGESPLGGLLLIVGSLVGAVVAAVLTRLFLESVAVLFRIANSTSEIARKR